MAELEFFTIQGRPGFLPNNGETRLLFRASRPAIIQPGEIVKVQTDLLVRVSLGHILNLSTAPELSKRAGELFPGLIAVSKQDGRHLLELPVRNSGRNPISVMVEQPMAVGYMVTVEPAMYSVKTLENDPAPDKPKPGPQKKNPGVKFELKGFPND